jgi:hypothetical protein
VLGLTLLIGTPTMAEGSGSAKPPFDMVVRDRIETGGQPLKAFFLPNGRELLVLNTRGYVSKIDLETRQVVAKSRHMIRGMLQAQLTPDGRHLMAWPSLGRKVYVVETGTLNLKRPIRCGRNHGGSIVSPDGKYALISAVQSRRVCIVDLETMDVVNRIRFPKAIAYLALNKEGTLASASAGVFRYGSSNSFPRGSHIFLFDPRPGHNPRVLEAGSFVSGRHPRGAHFTDTGHWVITANRLSGDVSFTDVRKGMVTDVIPTGRGAEAVVRVADGERYAIINRADTHISMIKETERGPVHDGDIYLSGAPYDLVSIPGGRFALVTILGTQIQMPATVWHNGRSFPMTFVDGRRVTHAKYKHGLSLIDLKTMQEVDFMKAGKGSMNVAIHPSGSMAAVVCATKGSVDLVY